MADDTSRVEHLLRAREAQGLEYSIWARLAFVVIAGGITLSNSQSTFDTVFTLTLVLAVLFLMGWVWLPLIHPSRPY